MLRALLPFVALAACAHADRVALGTATATLACDWSSTRAAASSSWEGTHENNMLLGRTPPTSTVDAYFAFAMATNVAVWALTPKRWRVWGAAAVTAAEVHTIYGNTPWTGVCGF